MFLLEKYEALGTLFWIEVFDEEITEEKKAEAREDIKILITHFENTYSRFKKDSLVSLLSRERRAPFDEDLYKMLTFGVSLEKKTDGLFSLFIGNKMIEKGYGKAEFSVRARPGKNDHEVWRVGDELMIGSSDGLDLGGLGKGYLIDLLKKRLEEKWGVREFLINGGGDIYVTSEGGKPLEIFLEHPKEEGTFLGSISLCNQAFASSSSFKRVWKKEGKETNHFITKGDDVWAAIFTISDCALKADAYTKVLMLALSENEKVETAEIDIYEKEYSPFLFLQEKRVLASPNFPKIRMLKN